MLNLSLIVYIFSISTQLSGGILLLLNFARFEDRFLQSYFSGSNLVEEDDDGYVHLDDLRVKGALRRTRLCSVSIALMIIGYLTSIFGEIGEYNKGCVFFSVMLLTIALVCVVFISLNIILEKTYKKHCLVRAVKLEKYGVRFIASTKQVKEYLGIN